MIYIFDIDGTIADLNHRLHYIQQKPAKWKEFFAACSEDKPIPEVIELVQLLGSGAVRNRAKIILVTGRSEECEEQTRDWLMANQVPYDELYMRKAGDHGEDSVVKAELLVYIKKDWVEDLPIAGVFEDRQQVVDMYRSKGLRVYQVAPGNF